MRRTASIAAAVLGVLAAATPATASTRHATGRTITIDATSQLEQAQSVDNPPAGPSAGDLLIFTEQLLDLHGRQIGRDAAECVQLFDASSLCTGTYVLPGGQVMVQLLHPGPEPVYTQAITGGTGRYAGATGTVTVRQQQGGDRFTFHIRLPSSMT
jgi:hypothetical protein